MFRSKAEECKSDGEVSSDEEPIFKLPKLKSTISQNKKKQNTIWTDVLLEQELDRVGSVYMEESLRVERGSESFEILVNEGNHLSPRPNPTQTASTSEERNDVVMGKSLQEILSIPIVTVSPADDDPFAEPADLSQVESFGFEETSFPPSDYTKRKALSHQPFKKLTHMMKRNWRPRQKRNHKDMTEANTSHNIGYPLERLLEARFENNLSLEQFGQQLMKIFNEKDPLIILQITKIVGREKALELFENTKQIELNGGILVQDETHRKSPGGVFISLFRQDPTIPQQIKDEIMLKSEDRQWKKAKRKERLRGSNSLSNMNVESIQNDSQRGFEADDHMIDDD